MLKTFAVSDLTPGMLVVRVVEQAGPMKIRKVGMIRSPDMVKGLQEMGVTKVEVDLAQSLNVEFDDAEGVAPTGNQASNIYSPNFANARPTAETAHTNAQTSKQTATQRLVATNKQVSDVDRQLSQQFHRSLFLPAVDQMPSKWTLYGKPYGYLLGFIVLGLSIGWLGASVPQYFLSTGEYSDSTAALNKEQDDVALANKTDVQSELPAIDSADITTSISDANTSNDDNVKRESDSSEGANKSPKVNAQQTSTANIPNADNTSNAQSTEPATLASTAQTNEANARQYESVNGVILESGQQVLGYRADEPEQNEQRSLQAQLDDTRQSQVANQQAQAAGNMPEEDENPVITNAPGFTTITEPNITNFNNDLLRKAQRAAELVDSQPAGEPEQVLKVTDLNTLPRIDQLTPAILTQMPSMSFSAHMYASNPQDRWVRVNGRRLSEGDYITDGLLIKQIESEKVVLSFRERDFTMNALTDW